MLKMQAKLDQSQNEIERLSIELDKSKTLAVAAREEEKRAKDEFAGMQKVYSRANSQLIKSKESEEKLRSELDKLEMDLEVVRERYERNQSEVKRYQLEKDKVVEECEQLKLQLSRVESQAGKFLIYVKVKKITIFFFIF